MSFYRKKPVVIEARQFTSHGPWTAGELAAWCGGRYYPDEPLGVRGKQCIEIDTLEGTHQAVLGDWIIKGVQGEFYPIKQDIFEQTYELAYGTEGSTP